VRGGRRREVLGRWLWPAPDKSLYKGFSTKKMHQVRRWFLINFELGVLFIFEQF
jgi:hypothetical protein